MKINLIKIVFIGSLVLAIAINPQLTLAAVLASFGLICISGGEVSTYTNEMKWGMALTWAAFLIVIELLYKVLLAVTPLI